MTKLLSVLLASLLLLSVASPVFAGNGGPRGENHCNRATPGGIQGGGHGNHG